MLLIQVIRQLKHLLIQIQYQNAKKNIFHVIVILLHLIVMGKPLYSLINSVMIILKYVIGIRTSVVLEKENGENGVEYHHIRRKM